MRFYPFEVSETHIVYACLGGFVVLFSMFSTVAKEKLYIGEVVFATLFGIIMGPSGFNVFRPRDWGNTSDKVTNGITLEVTRIALALGVFAIGVELPKSYMAIHWKSLTLLVVPVMLFGYISSAGILVALFPVLTYKSALVISACLTPTDPVLAAAIVGGHYAVKNVPGRIRRLLAAESAANDGLAYPFLWLPLYLLLDKTTGESLKDFITVAILYEIVLGTLIGVALGIIFARLMRILEKHGFIGPDSYVVQFVAMVLFIEGIVTLLGNDDLLASFAAGSAVSWDGHFNEQTEDNAVFVSLVESIMNCVVFVFIGAWIRFSDWTNVAINLTPGRLVAFFFSVLFIRRIPAVMLLYKTIPDIQTWQEALFCGWFGPMGVGAVFISTLALTYLPNPQTHPEGQLEILATIIQPIVAFTILGSILIHGLSIPAITLARSVGTMSRTWTLSGVQQPAWMDQTQRMDLQRDVDSRPRSRSPSAASAIATETLAGPSVGQALVPAAVPPANTATEPIKRSPSTSSISSLGPASTPSTIVRSLHRVLEGRSVVFASTGTSGPTGEGGHGGDRVGSDTEPGNYTGSRKDPVPQSSTLMVVGSASAGAQ